MWVVNKIMDFIGRTVLASALLVLVPPCRAAERVPKPVQAFADRVEQCARYPGDTGDTSTEHTAQIDQAIKRLRCDQLSTEGPKLKKHYAHNPAAQAALQKADDTWSGLMGESLLKSEKGDHRLKS